MTGNTYMFTTGEIVFESRTGRVANPLSWAIDFLHGAYTKNDGSSFSVRNEVIYGKWIAPPAFRHSGMLGYHLGECKISPHSRMHAAREGALMINKWKDRAQQRMNWDESTDLHGDEGTK